MKFFKQRKAKKMILSLPPLEMIADKVHEAWMQSKIKQGVTTRKAEDGEELMVPYHHLSEKAKDLDRATVKAVYVELIKEQILLSYGQGSAWHDLTDVDHNNIDEETWANAERRFVPVPRSSNVGDAGEVKPINYQHRGSIESTLHDFLDKWYPAEGQKELNLFNGMVDYMMSLAPYPTQGEDKREDSVVIIHKGDKWYWCKCESCGWENSSEYAEGGHPIADTGDYSDPMCPVCGSLKLEGESKFIQEESYEKQVVTIPLDDFLAPYKKEIERLQRIESDKYWSSVEESGGFGTAPPNKEGERGEKEALEEIAELFDKPEYGTDTDQYKAWSIANAALLTRGKDAVEGNPGVEDKRQHAIRFHNFCTGIKDDPETIMNYQKFFQSKTGSAEPHPERRNEY